MNAVRGVSNRSVIVACVGIGMGMALAFGAPAFGQTNNEYDLSWNSINGGGVTTSSGGGYQLGATIGQVGAEIMTGASYTLEGGFWVADGADCNTNGIDDETEIVLGSAFDCNSNTVLDSCDLAEGTSIDINANSTPDDCEQVANLVLVFGNNGRDAEDCIQPNSGSNETLTVRVDMANASAMVVGGQFFMTYDASVLDFVTAAPGDDPFTQEIFVSVDEGAGELTYAVGIQNNGTGTTADTTMAYLTFTAVPDSQNCAESLLVEFSDGSDDLPPTRLSGNNDSEVTAVLEALAAITVDGVAPEIFDLIVTGGDITDGSCQFTVTFSATVLDNCSIETPDVSVDVQLTTGNAQTDNLVINMTHPDAFTVLITGSIDVSEIENCPATIQVTVDATDNCGNSAVQAVLPADVNDRTSPEITDFVVTGGTTDENCQFTVTFTATVTDDCFMHTDDVSALANVIGGSANLDTVNLDVQVVDDQTVSVSGSVLVSEVTDCNAEIEITLDVTDDCDNTNQSIDSATVSDDDIPVISDLVVTGGSFNGDCEYTVTFTALVTDACAVNEGSIDVQFAVDGLNADLSDETFSTNMTDVTTVEVSGSVLVSNMATGCPATVRVTVTAEDMCGNVADPVDNADDVTDDTAPSITAPDDISVHSDAGECQATFPTLLLAEGSDNCDTDLVITFSRDDSQPNLLDPYQAGTTTITWTAEDNCGNTTTDTQVITVSGDNEVLVDVELSPTLDDTNGPFAGATLQRCITFQAWECPGAAPLAESSTEVIFPADAMQIHRTDGVSVLLPCGVYTCLTARDVLHTLRSTAPDFTDDGTTYSATYVGNRATGGHWMLHGNLNDDRFIDILDFGSFVIRFQSTYDSDGDTFIDGHTDCSTPLFHADISGDGRVFTEDFTFIQINFLKRHEDNCCGALGLEAPAPVRAISVADLWRMGMGELGAADLNADGMLDETDMATFAQGQGLDPTIPGVTLETKATGVPIAPAGELRPAKRDGAAKRG